MLPSLLAFCLSEENPLYLQWHPTRNVQLSPADVTVGSGKRVWWQCGKGHEWQAAVHSRVSGVGCPVCANKTVLEGYNDLGTVKPELAKQWHTVYNGNLTPADVTYCSGKKVWWRCKEGHEWQATIASRTHGKGCPYCSGRRSVLGQNDLSTVSPEVAAQWHPTKNGTLHPWDIKEKSGKKVWWQCEQGHEWRATPLKRAQGYGCPYCSGKRVIADQTSLAAVNAGLAAQWHPTKNGTLTPDQVSAGSGKKVWWICEKGHIWQSAVCNRSRGCGCPVCAGRQVLRGFNDLNSVNPFIAGEWHPTKNGRLTPFDVTANSNRKVWWRCARGHEWHDRVSNRLRSKGCAKCNAELHTSFAEQAVYLYVHKYWQAYNQFIFKDREIDIYIPSLSIGIEHDGPFHQSDAVKRSDKKKDTLLQDNGIRLIRIKTGTVCRVDKKHDVIYYADHEQNTLDWAIRQLFLLLQQTSGEIFPVDIDTDRDRGKIYQQYIRLEKEHALEDIIPDSQAYWNDEKNGSLRPAHFTAGSGKTVWWKCPRGHEWKSKIYVFAKGSRCPYCAGRKVLAGFNDLETVNPRLAKEWHPVKNGRLRPSDVSAYSNKKVWWQCEYGHEWEAAVNNRSNGKGCLYCTNQKVLPGYNDLAMQKPQLVKEWHPTRNGSLTPWDVTVRSGAKVWWICDKGHEWQARVADRSFGYGCPYCCGRKAVKGENDLFTLNPGLAQEWHPSLNGSLTPYDVKPYSHRKVWWLCSEGHVWQAAIASRTRGNGCPECYKGRSKKGDRGL